jgi:hypothetical protein
MSILDNLLKIFSLDKAKETKELEETLNKAKLEISPLITQGFHDASKVKFDYYNDVIKKFRTRHRIQYFHLESQLPCAHEFENWYYSARKKYHDDQIINILADASQKKNRLSQIVKEMQTAKGNDLIRLYDEMQALKPN